MPDRSQDLDLNQDNDIAGHVAPLPADDPGEEAAIHGVSALALADHAEHRRQQEIALRRLQDAAGPYRESQTKGFLKHLGRIQELCALVRRKPERIAIMMRDWQMSRVEALRLHRLRDIHQDEMTLYAAKWVSPEMIVALHKAKPEVREEAQVLIAAGRILHPADLAAMRKRRDASNRGVRRAIDERFLRAQASKVAAGQLAHFKCRLARMVRLLAWAYGKNWNDARERQQEFLRRTAAASAALVVDELNQLFPHLPAVENWEYNDPNDPSIRLAKVKLGLDCIAKGDFLLRDLTWSDGGGIELTLIQALAWLCDVDVAHLEYREAYPKPDSGPSWCLDDQPALTSLEICSGAGGAALGLHVAGFSSVGLIERNRHAVTTLIANRQLGPIFYKDVREVDYTAYIGKVDLFAGGVPCQPHSVLGNQAGEDDERDLFAKSVELVRLIQPRAIMLENVSGFAHRQATFYRAKIFEGLRDAGYDAELFAIRASDYCLAQARPRLVLVAMRDGLMSRFKMPPVLTPVPLGIGDALRDLMAENGWTGAEAWARRANRIGPTIVGGSEKSGKHGFSSNHQLEDWESLGVDASEIAAQPPGPDAPADHTPQLTLRMGAKLQGFPEAWTFKGPVREQRRQIANALPPIMACAVGLAIREALTGNPVDYTAELSQVGIEMAGKYREQASSVVMTARDLDLPLGDGYWKAIIDGFKDHRVPHKEERGKGLNNAFFKRYAKLGK